MALQVSSMGRADIQVKRIRVEHEVGGSYRALAGSRRSRPDRPDRPDSPGRPGMWFGHGNPEFLFVCKKKGNKIGLGQFKGTCRLFCLRLQIALTGTAPGMRCWTAMPSPRTKAGGVCSPETRRRRASHTPRAMHFPGHQAGAARGQLHSS